MVRIRTLGKESTTARRSALVLPGVNYTAQAPLLYWSTAALLSAGWHVRAVEWEEGDQGYATPQELIDHVFELNAAEASGAVDLVVAKSLGTLALPRCIEENVAGVWLTPLLNKDEVASALLAADRRHLAIGGTNDRHWLPEVVLGTGAELITVDDADHALLHKNWHESMRISNDIARRIDVHLAGL